MSEKSSRSGKGSSMLCALLSLLYFTSYVCRLNYSAAMADIIASGVLSKTQAGLIGTSLFFTYGFGQLVSGALSDRFSPDKIILSGLIITIGCNICMPVFGSPVAMTVIWGLNGFAQALFWPPLISIMATELDEPGFAKGNMAISIASHMATILIYAAVTALITVFDWKSTFIASAIWALICSIIWLSGYAYYKKKYTVTRTDTENNTAQIPVTTDATTATSHVNVGFIKNFISVGTVCILLAVALQGYLKDGIQSWLPTFFTEVFDFTSAGAILSNTVLPIFNIIMVATATFLFRKVFHDEVKEALFFFSLSVLLSLLLAFFINKNAALCLITSALITGSMHGINLMFISFLPRRYIYCGKVATVSGVCNACSYLGSALSSYGIALVAEHLGWSFTLVTWALIAFTGVILCLIALKK